MPRVPPTQNEKKLNTIKRAWHYVFILGVPWISPLPRKQRKARNRAAATNITVNRFVDVHSYYGGMLLRLLVLRRLRRLLLPQLLLLLLLLRLLLRLLRLLLSALANTITTTATAVARTEATV